MELTKTQKQFKIAFFCTAICKTVAQLVTNDWRLQKRLYYLLYYRLRPKHKNTGKRESSKNRVTIKQIKTLYRSYLHCNNNKCRKRILKFIWNTSTGGIKLMMKFFLWLHSHYISELWNLFRCFYILAFRKCKTGLYDVQRSVL